jgi:hypothetical protein
MPVAPAAGRVPTQPKHAFRRRPCRVNPASAVRRRASRIRRPVPASARALVWPAPAISTQRARAAPAVRRRSAVSILHRTPAAGRARRVSRARSTPPTSAPASRPAASCRAVPAAADARQVSCAPRPRRLAASARRCRAAVSPRRRRLFAAGHVPPVSRVVSGRCRPPRSSALASNFVGSFAGSRVARMSDSGSPAATSHRTPVEGRLSLCPVRRARPARSLGLTLLRKRSGLVRRAWQTVPRLVSGAVVRELRRRRRRDARLLHGCGGAALCMQSGGWLPAKSSRSRRARSVERADDARPIVSRRKPAARRCVWGSSARRSPRRCRSSGSRRMGRFGARSRRPP